MTWGKGAAYPLIGDKVRIRPSRQWPKGPFDNEVWEVYFFRSSQDPPYELVPWPSDRIRWDSLARVNIRAYEHDLVKLSILDQLVVAIEESEKE